VTTTAGEIEACIDATIVKVGSRIVLAAPLGIGKPNALINAFYQRAKANPQLQLTILTALSLSKPRAKNALEQRLLEPIVARIFADYEELDYLAALHRNALPKNIQVIEFFQTPGTLLNSPAAQQNYLYANYTDIASLLIQHGVNVIVQLLARRIVGNQVQLSLGSNPDVTVDLLPLLEQKRLTGKPVVLIGVVHPQMPFMPGTAEISVQQFDWLLDEPQLQQRLFAPPNLPINRVDHAIGLHASSLIRDGGTLQVGIGELGDALVYSLLLRHQNNVLYRQVLREFTSDSITQLVASEGGLDPFKLGLFASTEMFVDQLLDLYKAGILSRRVFDTVAEQRAALRGEHIAGGQVLHAGFFLGPNSFYQALRDLPEDERALFSMRGIRYINDWGGNDSELKILQRRDARFINTTMMVTLLGAAISDGLEDGRVVSGVGGQYNFVSMAHALPGARSILCLRATREKDGAVTSNIVWNYGHCTIPRHLRDIVITEYGIADLRGKTDQHIIRALLDICDSRFQSSLLAQAKAAGKIPGDYQIATQYQNNTPQRLAAILSPAQQQGFFPDYPFGTDLTAEEITLSSALTALNKRRERGHYLQLAADIVLRGGKHPANEPFLERMGLASAQGLQERWLARLVNTALNSWRATAR
jgi:acyl-CoA hydrolase